MCWICLRFLKNSTTFWMKFTVYESATTNWKAILTFFGSDCWIGANNLCLLHPARLSRQNTSRCTDFFSYGTLNATVLIFHEALCAEIKNFAYGILILGLTFNFLRQSNHSIPCNKPTHAFHRASLRNRQQNLQQRQEAYENKMRNWRMNWTI